MLYIIQDIVILKMNITIILQAAKINFTDNSFKGKTE